MEKSFPILEQKSDAWGDYGDMLMHGMAGRANHDPNGLPELQRAGPFGSPIFPDMTAFEIRFIDKLSSRVMSMASMVMCRMSFTIVCFTAKRFEKLAGGKQSATTGYVEKKLPQHPDKGARLAFLASIQDAWHHAFLTGGAPVGDDRLISAILSG